MRVMLTVPQAVIDKHRPDVFTEHTVRVPVRVWASGAHLTLKYVAQVFDCALSHRVIEYFAVSDDCHDAEVVPSVKPCRKCGADAQARTDRYRWVRSDGEFDDCWGCGAGWNRITQRANHKADCPYELIKSPE